MFKRTTIFALVAFASVTTAIVAPTTASAWGHGGRHFGGSHFGGRHFGGMHFGYRFGHFSRWSHYGSWRWERYRWYPRGPIVFGGPTEEGGGSGPVGGKGRSGGNGGRAPIRTTFKTPGNGENCLIKEYVDDGILFRDKCTGEESFTSSEEEQKAPDKTPEPTTPPGRRPRW